MYTPSFCAHADHQIKVIHKNILKTIKSIFVFGFKLNQKKTPHKYFQGKHYQVLQFQNAVKCGHSQHSLPANTAMSIKDTSGLSQDTGI